MTHDAPVPASAVPPRARSPLLFASLRPYDRAWLRGDVVAGLTVWAVLVPEALAYASIAGVSPVVGLYAAPGALLLYAAFGSSRHLVTGPMSATAALSAATVSMFATAGQPEYLAITTGLALTTAVLAAAAGLLRLGFLANFISEPVLKGFIIGLALTIIAGQLPKLFGVAKGSGDFFEQIWDLATKLGDTSGLTLIVGLVSLAVVLVLRRFMPIVPGSLVVVLLGIILVKLFDLDAHGVAIVGHIDSGLPSLGFPDVHAARYEDLVPGAAGILLVGFAEGLGAAKTYAAQHHYEVDANRELVGLGAANFGSGLAGGMVVNGSLSKTAVNGSAGAKSQLSGLVVAALTIVTLLFLTGLFESLPEATLAAVVIAAWMELVDLGVLRRLYRLGGGRQRGWVAIVARPDFIAAVAALAGVLVFDTLPGLFIGIVVSMLLLLYRVALPPIAVLGKVRGTAGQYGDVSRHPENERVPGLVILRVDGGLFFGNADALHRRLTTEAARAGVKEIVVDAETIAFIDVTAGKMLAEAADELSRTGVRLVLAHGIGDVRRLVRRTEAAAIPIYSTVQDAVDAYRA